MREVIESIAADVQIDPGQQAETGPPNERHRFWFSARHMLELLTDIPTPLSRVAALAAGLAVTPFTIAGGALAPASKARPAAGDYVPVAMTSSGPSASVSETVWPVPHVSPSQAVSYLDEQRAANGLPTVSENRALDGMCTGMINHGSPAPPAGYNAYAGTLGGKIGQWNRSTNPWSDVPVSLDVVFDPVMTQAGYAETPMKWQLGQTCLQLAGNDTFTAPAFYSLPGNGATTRPWEVALPTSNQDAPGEAAGIPEDAKTGPYILLWPEGDDIAELQSAALTGPNGPVSVKVVRPGMPYPAQDGGGVVESISSYVIPPQPLKPDSSYTLDARWTDSQGETYPQEVRFKTGSAVDADAPFHCDSSCPHGRVQYSVRGDDLRVSMDPAAGQRVTVRMEAARAICLLSAKPCPKRATEYEVGNAVTETIRHYRKPVTFRLPERSMGFPVLGVVVSPDRFTAKGYQWEPNPLRACSNRAAGRTV